MTGDVWGGFPWRAIGVHSFFVQYVCLSGSIKVHWKLMMLIYCSEDALLMLMDCCCVKKSLWKLAMNSRLSLSAQTSILSLLNHTYQLDSITKYQLQHEFSLAWNQLQTLVSCHGDGSLVSSLAVITLAVVLRHGPQSLMSQSVLECCFLVWRFQVLKS